MWRLEKNVGSERRNVKKLFTLERWNDASRFVLLVEFQSALILLVALLFFLPWSSLQENVQTQGTQWDSAAINILKWRPYFASLSLFTDLKYCSEDTLALEDCLANRGKAPLCCHFTTFMFKAYEDAAIVCRGHGGPKRQKMKWEVSFYLSCVTMIILFILDDLSISKGLCWGATQWVTFRARYSPRGFTSLSVLINKIVFFLCIIKSIKLRFALLLVPNTLPHWYP